MIAQHVVDMDERHTLLIRRYKDDPLVIEVTLTRRDGLVIEQKTLRMEAAIDPYSRGA
jgi:hypothetical protein